MSASVFLACSHMTRVWAHLFEAQLNLPNVFIDEGPLDRVY